MRNQTQHYCRGRRTPFQQNANAGAKIVLRARESVSSRQKRRAGAEGGSGPWRGAAPRRAPAGQRSGDAARATTRIGRRSRWRWRRRPEVRAGRARRGRGGRERVPSGGDRRRGRRAEGRRPSSRVHSGTAFGPPSIEVAGGGRWITDQVSIRTRYRRTTPMYLHNRSDCLLLCSNQRNTSAMYLLINLITCSLVQIDGLFKGTYCFSKNLKCSGAILYLCLIVVAEEGLEKGKKAPARVAAVPRPP